MKSFLIFFSFVTFIFAQSSVVLTPQEQQYLLDKKTIKMCVDPDWEPFEIINKDGVHEGIANDLISFISSQIGVKIELVKTKDWDESIIFSQEHKCDILSFLNETPKRKEWLTFTEPIFYDPNVLVGRSERKYIEDISQEHLTIALPRNTAMAERFAKDFPNLTIIPTTSESEAFKLVEDRKADITLRSLIVTAFTIKKDGLFNLKIIGEPRGYENILKIGVRKDEPILRDILNHGIAKLTQKETDKIINKHVSIVIEKVTYLTIAFWGFLAVIMIAAVILLWNYILRRRVTVEVAKNLKQKELLFEQKRKAELGELIANISHQWRNGLANISAINLHLMVLSDEVENISSKDTKAFTKKIDTSIEFMSQTMEVFLNFYKNKKQHDSFNLLESINTSMIFIDILIKTNKLKIDIIENDKIHIDANINEWIHIWLNLFTNTINEAIKKSIIAPQVTITITQNQVLYQDNCKGFEEETLKSIQNDESKGLGLKMSKDILDKYNCKLKIENKEDGALFILSLPINTKEL